MSVKIQLPTTTDRYDLESAIVDKGQYYLLGIVVSNVKKESKIFSASFLYIFVHLTNNIHEYEDFHNQGQ